MPSATTEISYYNFMNPYHSSHIEVEFEGKIGKFDLEKVEDGYRSTYELHIPDTEEFGFVRREDADQAIQDLLTAINLRCISGAAVRPKCVVDTPQIDYTEEELDEYDIGTTVGHVGTGISQPIPEKAIFETFQQIRELDREHIIPRSTVHIVGGSGESDGPVSVEKFLGNLDSPNIEEVNLRKALLAYDGAMEAFDKSIQHLLLFAALETAADVEGDDLWNADLEDAISEASDVDREYIEQWRNIYHRQKHADRKPDEIRESLAGLTSKGLNLHGMRKASIRAITSSLH